MANATRKTLVIDSPKCITEATKYGITLEGWYRMSDFFDALKDAKKRARTNFLSTVTANEIPTIAKDSKEFIAEEKKSLKAIKDANDILKKEVKKDKEQSELLKNIARDAWAKAKELDEGIKSKNAIIRSNNREANATKINISNANAVIRSIKSVL